MAKTSAQVQAPNYSVSQFTSLRWVPIMCPSLVPGTAGDRGDKILGLCGSMT